MVAVTDETTTVVEPDDLPADYGDDEQADSLAAADPPDDGCPHPPSARRLHDGQQVCTLCGMPVEGLPQTIMPRDRPGGVDPTQREGTARSQGGLRHITWDPETPAASRPYTPDEVEMEIVDTLDRIERGAGWLTTKEEERVAAKVAYELAYARARFTSKAKTVGEREDDALLRCREQYEEWQLLELQCRTAREGMHNLRSKLSGTQSVLRSVSEALRGGGGQR